MPLRIHIEPGGEIYHSFAEKKLAELKRWMKESGILAFSKTYWLNDSEHIFVSSTFFTDAVSADTIRINAGGITDYVALAMPNPVPYRGVSIGVVDKSPAVSVAYTDGAFPNRSATVTLSVGGSAVESYSGAFSFFTAVEVWFGTPFTASHYVWSTWPSPAALSAGTPLGSAGAALSAAGTQIGGEIITLPGVGTVANTTVVSAIPGYGVAAAAAGGVIKTYVTASDGEVLASEVQNIIDGQAYYVPNIAWNGEGYSNMHVDTTGHPVDHQLTFTVPEDCNHPVPAVSSLIFNTRRKAWFKKNSDEFIAALKTGFAPGTPGVTRAELQTGYLPSAWEYQIKRDVDVKYDSYAPASTVGRKTRRAIQYSETAFLDTVLSDTSANLTQAGVKITERAATLTYTIPVTQPDGSVVQEPRERSVVGTLTQTVTRHNDSVGNQLGLSRQDVYDTWYNREATTLPSGVPSTITAAYLKDRTTSRIGVVLNGTVQTGYNADSTLGVVGNPLTYALYIPPFPKTSSTVTADLIPDFIATWHKDAKITYDKTGATGSNVLNDSALHGVTRIEITPVGVPEYGMFADITLDAVKNSTQVEVFGTAVYRFDWQTGALTFSKWKPLKDAEGNEVASRIVDLPAGTIWNNSPVNCLVTYHNLHWPDVVDAIRTRDKALPTATAPADKILYALIQAAKGI